MKKLNLNISKFDLGYIIAAVVVMLLGIGAWWYLSGALQDAQLKVTTAKAAYDKFSADSKSHFLITPQNAKTLQSNIDLLKGQIDPLIPDKLQSKDNKLHSIEKQDPVAWKHELDDKVHQLTAAAKSHGVTLPPNFYFGFSRYLSQSPNDEQTPVLTKQLLGMEQIASILIKAPVRNIVSIKRTYEEDPHATVNPNQQQASDAEHVGGFAATAPGNAYVAYPFEVEFITTSEDLRPILDDLVQSPYVFIVRTIEIKNGAPSSPTLGTLDTLAGAPAAGQGGGGTPQPAAGGSTLGPQYLFGDKPITVKARIDMIEWKGGQQ